MWGGWVGWVGVGWVGVGWVGMGWVGVGWEGVGWEGVGWEGVGWVAGEQGAGLVDVTCRCRKPTSSLGRAYSGSF